MSRAKGGVLVLIPVCTVVPSKVHLAGQCCGNIIDVFLKLLKAFKTEHCLRVGILGDALYLRFPIILDTYGIGIDDTVWVVM